MFTEPLRRFVRGRQEAAKTRRFHDRMNAWAKTCYESMVTQDPARDLSSAQKKQIREYSEDVFGSGKFAPWLGTYTVYHGEFLEGWIPENYFREDIAPVLGRRYNHITGKIFARRLLGAEYIPDIAYHINGFWLDQDHSHLEPSEVKDHLFAGTDAVFIKTHKGARGEGVRRVTPTEFDPEQLSQLGDFVVQSAIEQHRFFTRFTSSSIATLRITTLKARAQRAESKASILYLGRDGATIVTRDALRVPVDDQGTLRERAIVDTTWESFTAHPDSQITFSGERIPGFRRAIAMCEKLHDENPYSMLIGWDVAIDRSCSPVLMEWNQIWGGIAFLEASLGPCFSNLGWEKVWKDQRPQS
jgi:hypothetical protein